MTCSGKLAEPILTVGLAPVATADGLAAGLAAGLATGLAAAGLAAGGVVGFAGAVAAGAVVGLGAPPAWQALKISASADAPAASTRILRIGSYSFGGSDIRPRRMVRAPVRSRGHRNRFERKLSQVFERLTLGQATQAMLVERHVRAHCLRGSFSIFTQRPADGLAQEEVAFAKARRHAFEQQLLVR